MAIIKCWETPLKEEKAPEQNDQADALLEENKTTAKPKEVTNKKKEVPKVAQKCPLFESNVVGIGFSNKAHPSHKNVIQLMFVKTAANSME